MTDYEAVYSHAYETYFENSELLTDCEIVSQRAGVAAVVASAKADALEDAATFLSEPRKVWHGDDGVSVLIDESLMTRIPLVQWLRRCAAKIRNDDIKIS